MSAAQAASFANSGKKAVHVKWAGKTIALGTFPSTEADEKCARAKALTRAWRSTMRPKPTREWVMIELERLGVRVVSGRLGRKAGEEGDDDDPDLGDINNGTGPGNDTNTVPSNNISGGGSSGAGDLPAEINSTNNNSAAAWGADAELNRLMARRNSSLGFSTMMDGRRGSLGSLGGLMGLDSGDPSIFGMGLGSAGFGIGSDFSIKGPDQQRRNSSLGLGSLAGGGIGNIGMSVNPNQHYEMLKLHHMNLLNEIQETTLMMNLYQQQQLQQQQQLLQQQASAEGLNASGLHQSDNQFDLLNGAARMQHRTSLGLGDNQLNFASQQMLMQQQLMSNNASSNNLPGGISSVVTPGVGTGASANNKGAGTQAVGDNAMKKATTASPAHESVNSTSGKKRAQKVKNTKGQNKRSKATDDSVKVKSEDQDEVSV